MDAVQIVTTTAKLDDAREIASALVKRRLAACVQIDGPLESTYRWQGSVETATEWRCVIKTRAALYSEVEATILDLHPYEEPEILVLPISSGSAGYLDWLRRETSPVDGPEDG